MATFENYLDIKYDVRQISNYMLLLPSLTLNKFLEIMLNKIKSNEYQNNQLQCRMFIKTVGIHLLKYAELQDKLEYELLLRPFVYALYKIDILNISKMDINNLKYTIKILYNSLGDQLIKKLFISYCAIILETNGHSKFTFDFLNY